MKNLKIINRIIFTSFELIDIIAVSAIFYLTIPIKITPNIENKNIKLPKGSVTNTINYLIKESFKLSPIDKYLLVAIGQPKVGYLKLKQGEINRIDFLYKLTTNAVKDFDIITLIPGETKSIFLQNLSKDYGLDYKKLEESYSKYSPYPEAGIIPDTYHITKGIKEDKLISFLINISEKRYQKLAQKELNRYDKNEWLVYLTIASIIQKEAANVKEMPKISSVIFNRLKRDMPLQMDGTLNYGKYSHIKITPKRIKEDKSRFNTYLNKGLPPYPICAVSMEAIVSAIHPIESNYLFFMKNKEGFHDFTDSYEEHLRNIERAKKE